MHKFTALVVGLVLLGWTPVKGAGVPAGSGPGSPAGGFLLSDLVHLSAAGMMQEPAHTPAPAAAPTAPPSLWTLGGYAEFSYIWNTETPDNVANSSGGVAAPKENSFRVFDVNHNEFNFHAVQLSAAKAATEGSWVGFTVTAMAGQDAKYIHSNGLFDDGTGPVTGAGEDFDVVNANLTIKIPDEIFPMSTVIKIGKWETHHGAEVISGPMNHNFSRSYLFGFAIPFTHTGIMIDTAWLKRQEGGGELFGTGLGLVNGWDNVKDNNDGKSWMGQLRFTPADWFEAHGEGVFGPEQANNESDWRGLFDLNATVKGPKDSVLEGFSLTGNYDYGWEDGAGTTVAGPNTGGYATWFGFAGYLRYDFARTQYLKKFYLAFRGEIFDDDEGARTGIVGGQEFIELTTTIGYRPWESLLVRLEHRYDKADDDVFASDDTVDNHINTFSVNFVVFY